MVKKNFVKDFFSYLKKIETSLSNLQKNTYGHNEVQVCKMISELEQSFLMENFGFSRRTIYVLN